MRRPRFIAEQSRHARGPLGRLIAWIMAVETRDENRRAIRALRVGDGDHVLDVGCGHGRSLAALAEFTPHGRVAGVDPSELMVAIAAQRNRQLVKAGRVDVTAASADALPFPDEAFDKALCVHVVYFWTDLDPAVREIARVLKPGGRLALLFRTDADTAAVQAFPAEIYRFPAITDVVASLERAGFALDDGDGHDEPPAPRPALLLARRLRVEARPQRS